MADTQKLRDLAASYRWRGGKGESDLVARYNLDMARYLDSIVATVEAAAGPGEAEFLLQTPKPEQKGRGSLMTPASGKSPARSS